MSGLKAASRPVGSLGAWAYVRIGQLLVLVWYLDLSRLTFTSSRNWVFLFILAYIYIQFDSFVYGYADESGLHYKRYFRWAFSPWQAFARVENTRFLPTLVFKDDHFLRRGLMPVGYGPDEGVREQVSGILTNRKPEVVKWLEGQIEKASP